jgi:hypothetical protein
LEKAQEKKKEASVQERCLLIILMRVVVEAAAHLIRLVPHDFNGFPRVLADDGQIA